MLNIQILMYEKRETNGYGSAREYRDSTGKIARFY